jgi:hypothetical protein
MIVCGLRGDGTRPGTFVSDGHPLTYEGQSRQEASQSFDLLFDRLPLVGHQRAMVRETLSSESYECAHLASGDHMGCSNSRAADSKPADPVA